MDFNEIDIHSFLKASIPHRFQDIGPYDFEKFMATLFRADGYTVQETDYSGDYGADLLLTKEGVTTAVQVKRYAAGTLVGVNDINQVIGARSYYKTQNALVVTTSDFTAPAINLGKTASVFLWNWSRLEQYISTVYLEKKDYYAFFGDTVEFDISESSDREEMFQLELLEVDDDVQTPDGQNAISLHLGLTNTSNRNLTVHVDLPIAIAKKSKRQVTAMQWKENYFFHGVLVSGATVELACFYPKAQVPVIKTGDRMILHIHVTGDDQPYVLDETLRIPGRNCYIVTHCYGRTSEEYRSMILFRDSVLVRSPIGKWLTDFYYQTSPGLVQIADRSPLLSSILGLVVKPLIRLCVVLIRK